MTTDKAKLRRLLSAGLGNQVISSLTNFVFGVYLLKTMLPADYGLYNIAFAVMVFIGGFSQGFFLVQMTVLSPAKHANERTAFAERTLLLLATACLVFLVLAAFGILALQTYGVHLGSAGLPWLIVLTAVAYMLKEFHIRHAFNEARGHDAVLVHAALALALLIGVLLSETIGHNMQVDTAMFLYMLAHVLAAALGQWRSGMTFSLQPIAQLRATLQELRIGGKWAAATNVVYAIRSQAHTILVAASVGTTGVAQLNATRLVVTPAILLLPSLSQAILPHLALLKEEDGHSVLWRTQRRISIGLASIAITYSLLILATFDIWEKWIFGDKFPDSFSLVIVWCTYTIAISIRSSIEWTAQVNRNFKHLTNINVIASAITIILTSILTLKLGSHGAVAGLVLGEIYVAAHTLLVVRKNGRR